MPREPTHACDERPGRTLPALRRHARPRALAACLGLALAASAWAAGGPHAPAATPGRSSEQAYSLALEAQTEKRYPEMIALLREASAAGHVEAQEMLGAALLAGSALYGTQVPPSRCEAHQWFLAAARNGSALGVFYVHLLNQTRGSPAAARCRPGQP
jgi:TPR repeat protein